uniref:Uncharacterized protein n=1 Tax=Anopheles coluzzii TaxID=1518534 RepID=A0A8W7PRT1_ANOCL
MHTPPNAFVSCARISGPSCPGAARSRCTIAPCPSVIVATVQGAATGNAWDITAVVEVAVVATELVVVLAATAATVEQEDVVEDVDIEPDDDWVEVEGEPELSR